MSLAFTLVDQWHDGKRQHLVGTIAASSSYVTGGDTLDLSDDLLPSQEVPVAMEIHGEAGFVYNYIPGTDLSDGKVMTRYADYDAVADGALIEIPAAAYPAGVTGDTIRAKGVIKNI